MNCEACGAEMREGAKACLECGHWSGEKDDTVEIQMPQHFLDVVILKQGERLVRMWSADTVAEAPPSAFGASNQNPYRNFHLALLLTNFRLIAIHESGIMTSRYDLFNDLALEDVRGISLQKGLLGNRVIISYGSGGPRSQLVLTGIDERVSGTQNGSQEFPTSVSSSCAPEFKAVLDAAVRRRIAEAEEEKKRDRIVLDFSFLKEQLAKGGLVVQSVKCPSCGASVELPKEGSTAKCSYCGAVVQATDLFARLKSLLS